MKPKIALAIHILLMIAFFLLGFMLPIDWGVTESNPSINYIEYRSDEFIGGWD